MHFDSILTQAVPNEYFCNIWVCLWLLEIDFDIPKSQYCPHQIQQTNVATIFEISLGGYFRLLSQLLLHENSNNDFPQVGDEYQLLCLSLFYFSYFQPSEMDVVQHQSFVPLIQAKTALIGLVMHRKLIDLRFAIICYNEIDATKPKLNARRKNVSQITYSWPLPGAHRRRIVLAYIGWAENVLETRNNGYAFVRIDIFTIWSDWLIFLSFRSRWQI